MTETEFRALWAQIAGNIGDGDGQFTLAAASKMMKENAHAIFQHVFNVGHSERNKAAKTEVDGLTAQIATLTTERDALQAKLDDAGKDQPEAARRVTELEGQIRTLQAEVATKEKDFKRQVAEARIDARLEGLRTKLVRDGMDDAYAEVLTMRPEVRQRLRLNDDGTFDVLQPSGGIPFAAADGKDGLDLLSGELVEATRSSKPSLIRSDAEGGSGTGANGGRPAGDTRKGGAAFFEGIRKGVAEAEKAAAPAGGTAAQRMGIRNVDSTQ